MQVLDVSIRYSMQKTCTIVAVVGRTMAGNSVCVFVEGWYAHLVIQAPVNWKDTSANCQALAQLLDEKIATRIYETPKQAMFKKMRLKRYIQSIVTMRGESIMGYHANNISDFLMIRVVVPSLVGPLRDCFHGYSTEDGLTQRVAGTHVVMVSGSQPRLSNGATQTFGSAVEPKVQFISDMGASGYQWLEVCGIRRARTSTTCDYEMDAGIQDVTWIDLRECAGLAPLRLLSFDIEAAGSRGTMPDSSTDPCIMIGINLSVMRVTSVDTDKQIPSILLCLGSCDEIEGCFVLCFDDEADMLRAFANIVSRFDADCIFAYNQNNFDFPYLLGRAVRLEVDSHFCSAMSRIIHQKFKVVVAFFKSAQTGTRQRNKIDIPGRCSVDVFVYVLANYKRDSYKLGDVANYFLGHGKEDIYFGDITAMWKADSAQRRTLGVYCLKDAILPLLLDTKLCIVLNVIEACRIFGMTADLFLHRGAMLKVDSLVYGTCIRRAARCDSSFFIPYREYKESSDSIRKSLFQGATVFEVRRGMHFDVGVLDFKSMYPSILLSKNMCPTTMVSLPDGTIVFVDESVRKGIFPEMVEGLMTRREVAKLEAANEKDPMMHQVLNARQLQLKIACNSIYGGLGSEFAAISLRALAEIITAQGRVDIQRVHQIATSIFTPENGYPGSGVSIVCGDTDSIFVCFTGVIPAHITGVPRLEEVFRLCNILAAAVNAEMAHPKQIEVEKVCMPIINFNKKKYVALVVATPTSIPKVDIKGMDCVRRNGCALVRKNVGDVLDMLVRHRDVDLAAAAIRTIVAKVVEDEYPLDQYVMRQVLRKSKPDCSRPMPPKQLLAIRNQLKMPNAGTGPLSYAETDAAIRAKIPLHFDTTSLMPHVEVAWRMRLRDPLSAPVPGDVVEYVVTSNGRGKKVSEKAETIQDVTSKLIPVDRAHYLAKLRDVFDKIMAPLYYQQAQRDHATLDLTEQDLQAIVKQSLNSRVWVGANQPLKTSQALKRARVHESPIAVMFRKAAANQSAT